MRRLLCICIAVAMITSGCTLRTKQEIKEEPLVESDENYRITKHQWQNICFYDIVSRDFEGRNPLVFFLHGLGGRKEEVISYARELADEGYTVVALDCAGHGENQTDQSLNFCDIIQQTAAGCLQILDYYQNSDYGDPSQFSMAGISMGGMIALYFAANSPVQPKSVAAVCATPDWESLLGGQEIYVQLQNGEQSTLTDAEQRKELIVSMIQASPDQNMERLLQTPILMLNGREDTTIPVSAIEAFEVKASLFPNQLTCVIQEGRIHEVDEGDLNRIINFLKQYMPTEVENELEG